MNTTSTFDEEVVSKQVQLPLREHMSEPPTEEEIMEAIDHVKRNKAGGSNGILPEMLKTCGANIIEYIKDLFETVWHEGVPQEWKDATLIPIPKKGDLSQCDNWQGISLLDVFGKVLAKVIQMRLQDVVEEVVPDSQCGFRHGRGCIDMVFCVKQLVEKSVEHNTNTYILFIDLRKAYDSVPRQALWTCLEKYGIPSVMVEVIKSFHEDMRTTVTVDGDSAPVFEVKNGLRQGCTIAPTLFTLYFNMVINSWRERCKPFGVEILYKCGGKLVGERTRRPETTILTEFLFADDAAAICTNRSDIEKAARILDEVTSEWGLTVSFPKTKLLVAGPQSVTPEQPIIINEKRIDVVSDFRYLGVIIEATGAVRKYIEDRVAKASRAFGALKKAMFINNSLLLKTKRLVYRAVVLGVLLYGVETLALKRDHLEVFHNRCLRAILGITTARQKMERITTIQVRKKFGMEEALEDLITAHRLRWLGHVARMENDRLPKQMLFGWLPQRRPAHGTKLNGEIR